MENLINRSEGNDIYFPINESEVNEAFSAFLEDAGTIEEEILSLQEMFNNQIIEA
jgi:hypothetical protein